MSATRPSVVPGRVALDLGMVVALSTLALLGLDDSYATRAYLVVGLIAVVAMAGWGLLCLVQGYGAGVYVLVASLAYPIVGASSALHDLDWLGFPSAQGMADVLTATLTAPTEFLTTIPPVDAKGVVLVIPHLIGFLLGGAAVWLALRTSRPLLPVLPLILAMVLCIALGTESPDGLLVRASAFAVLVLLWVVLRSARLRRVGQGERGRTARAVGAAVATLAAVGVVSVLLPPVPTDARVVLRGRVGNGQDVSQLDNPLAGFRRNTPQPKGTADNVADKRLLKVTGLPRGQLLRYVALDVYDGSTWSAGNRTVSNDALSLFQRIGEEVGVRRPGRSVRVSVEVKRPWTSSWLPLSGQLTGITFDYLDGRAQRSDVRYNVATETGMVVGGLGARDDYTFTAVLPDTSLDRRMRAYGDGQPLVPEGAFLDRYVKPWKQSGLTPVQQVYSLAKYLRVNGRYSDGGSRVERRYLPGHSEARLGTEFIGAKAIVGDDEQYAAFMALAANRLGVPARVVVGSRPNAKGWVRGRNALAWVELRVADGSWRILPPRTFMSHKPPKRSDTLQSPENFVRRDAGSDEPAQNPPSQNQPAAKPGQQQPPGGGLSPLVWQVPLGLLLLGGVPFLKWWRRRGRQRAPRPSRRVVGAWEEVLDLVRDQSRPVEEGLPRAEQARRLGLSVPLALRADELVFARDEPTADEAREVWRASRAERRRVAATVGWPQRLVALYRPRSLVHAWLRHRRGRRGSRLLPRLRRQEP